jgi:hypothetical protein
VLAGVLVASAGAAVSWQVVADGPTSGGAVAATKAFVALTRAGAHAQLSGRVKSAGSKLAAVDYTRDALVGVFGEFGCNDSLVKVSSLAQHGRTLAVSLVQQRPAPGTARCLAIYGTYRLLTVPKSTLKRPYPTRATVSLVHA